MGTANSLSTESLINFMVTAIIQQFRHPVSGSNWKKTKISGTRIRGSEQAKFNYASLKASRLTDMDKNIECSQVNNEVRHNKTNN